MKKATTALLYILSAFLVFGGEPSKNKLVGIWWGTAIDPEYGSAHQRDHWVIERKLDGTYRVQEFRVDHKRKVYFEFPEKAASGKWSVQGESITHRLNGNGHVQTDVFRFEGRHVHWDRKTQTGLDRYQVHFTEKPIERFVPSLGKTYRRVSEEAFDKRLEPKGESGPRD